MAALSFIIFTVCNNSCHSISLIELLNWGSSSFLPLDFFYSERVEADVL